jgi:hypothetical protein
MDKNKIEQQTEELIGMNFSVPNDLTVPMQMKLSNELARQLQKSKSAGKIFWAGAAVIVLINTIGIGIHVFGSGQPETGMHTSGSVADVAGYYYTDKMNSY